MFSQDKVVVQPTPLADLSEDMDPCPPVLGCSVSGVLFSLALVSHVVNNPRNYMLFSMGY